MTKTARRAKKLKTTAVQSLFNKAIVARDGKCVICGKRENLQCSHFYTVGAHNGLRFHPWNANTMCAGCHIKHHNADPLMYVLWFGNNYPERLKWITSIKNNSIRYSQPNLRTIKMLIEEDDSEVLANYINEYLGVWYKGGEENERN